MGSLVTAFHLTVCTGCHKWSNISAQRAAAHPPSATAGGSALGFARGLLVDRHMLANAMILATLSSCNPPRSDAFSQPSFISLANTKIRTEYL
jgi:hypothetical protein